MTRDRFLNNNAFTLLEVLLSLALFSIIALTTIKQINLIRMTKDTAFRDIDAYSNARAAINAIESDVHQAFHILNNDLGDDARTALSQNASAVHTLFDGRKSEIVFTALSHRNYFSGKKESEQTEISYFLQSSRTSKYSTLLKRESEIIDENPYEGGQIYTLLENVISAEFSYFDPKTDKWVESWNSEFGERRDIFPSAIRVRLTVASDKGKPLTIDTALKISFPNNSAYVVNF